MSKSTKEHKAGKEYRPNNFRLAIIDNHTHKHLLTIYFTRTKFLVAIITFAVTICIVLFSLIAFTPIRTFIPGYPDARSKRDAIQNAIKLDSLETVIYKWGLYAENLKNVMEGMDPAKLDSLVYSTPKAATTEAEIDEIMKKDSLLRERIKEEEKFGISSNKKRKLPIEGMHFFNPLKGAISQSYDPVSHPYIDISAPAGSVVKATLNGTVIYTGWDDLVGYTIHIQHEGDIISIYKHNEKILKKSGDKVTAGEPIAFAGNTGSLHSGDHLHFELWYKGNSINPADYINF